MEQNKTYLSPFVEIVELGNDVVTGSKETPWNSDWGNVEDDFA
jgi:hypothetical protein